jgi:hypothetical protein
MRIWTAALVAALTFVVLAVPVAGAAPTEVDVRIEGRTETLFEGPILTDGHNVRASSDSKAPAAGRRCNGLNDNANPAPGPPPTAAAADAMSILGQGFDGDWYAAPFEDYFITQWGPDRQSAAANEYWGLIVNDVFTDVGGCQFQDRAGDEVLWAYDAFNGRPRLLLYPGDYSGGPVRLTAEATLGVPFEVEVDAWDSNDEGAVPASPQRSTNGYEGAVVAPVEAGPGGFERVDAGSPEAVPTDLHGRAPITFATPGWHRLKATQIVAGKEAAIRSNRLDVCVAATPGAGCGPAPADDAVRIPPDPDPGAEDPGGGGPGPETPGAALTSQLRSAGSSAPATEPGAVRLRLARLDRSRLAAGTVGVAWKVLDAGPGIARWTVSSLRLGKRGGSYVVRARGTGATAATLHLPAGAGYRLQLTVVDALGRSSSAVLGTVQVPR